MLSEDELDKILWEWDADCMSEQSEDYPDGEMHQYARPSHDDVLSLVRTAFFASINPEEGEYVSIGLMLIPGEGADPWLSWEKDAEIIELLDPAPMTVNSVTKLSQLISPKTGSLLVRQGTGAYEIFGVAPFLGPHHNSFLDARMPGYRRRPGALVVNSTGAGVLTIARGDRLLAMFGAGELRELTFEDDCHPWNIYRGAAPLWADLQQRGHSHLFPEIYVACIEKLITCALQEGHGASLVFTPYSAIDAARSNIHGGHRLRAKESVKKLIESCADTWGTQSAEFVGEALQLRAKLRAIARLSRPDGALLLTDDIRPYHLGARLKAPVWEGKVTAADPLLAEDMAFDRTKYGTRHNSAIDFVAQVASSVAIVLSSDGAVRAFARQGDVVSMWPDCLLLRRF